MVGIDELIKRPAGELYYAVVESRLEAGLCLLRNSVGNFIEGIADGNLGRYFGDRIAGRLGC